MNRALGWWESADDAPRRRLASDHRSAFAASTRPTRRRFGRSHRTARADLAQAGLDEAYALDAKPWRPKRPVACTPCCGRPIALTSCFEFSTTTPAARPGSRRCRRASAVPRQPGRASRRVRHAGRVPGGRPAQDDGRATGRQRPGSSSRGPYLVSAWCSEAYGDFERVEAEYERAAEIARNANAPSIARARALQPPPRSRPSCPISRAP